MSLLPSFAFASSGDDVRMPTTPDVGTVRPVDEQLQSVVDHTPGSKLQKRASQLIKERMQALLSNKNIIERDKNLTDEQKKILIAPLDSTVTGLNTLGATIASSTDATSTKALVSRITSDYRVFGIVIPQVRLEKRIFDLQNHSQKLSQAFLKIQTKIDEQKTKGKDVTEWQKNLDDAKALVALDMNSLATMLPKVTALKPIDYGTSSKATIDSVNVELKKIAKDFNSISKVARKPVLKEMKHEEKRENKGGVQATTTPKSL